MTSLKQHIQSGVATCRKGFVICFQEVPQPVELSEKNLQNLFYKLPPQTVVEYFNFRSKIQLDLPVNSHSPPPPPPHSAASVAAPSASGVAAVSTAL